MPHYCHLCKSEGIEFYNFRKQLHHQCPNCRAIFINKDHLLDSSTEIEHYEKHNNDVEDEGYQNFVSPITNAILKEYSDKHEGLDFGAGTGPVISKVLKDNNYQILQYDPYFHNYPNLLTKQYDYIACCEVIEHFYEPKKEFQLLKSLLKPEGKLYCMTHIYDESIDFHEWYYKNDPTHVFIYMKETLEWIKKKCNFSDVNINDRLITFTK